MRVKIIVVLCLSIVMVMNTVSTVYGLTEQSPSNIYVVQQGDTLKKIAAQYDTTAQELKLTNGLQSPALFVGQRLRVPVMYEVNAGDTLEQIAAIHHSSVHEIKAINGLSSDSLYVGQILRVPPKRMAMDGQHILMTRAEFKDWLLHQKFKRKVRVIQQHHTWAPSYKQFKGSNHFALLKGMQNFHMNEMGWSNIAQNITTFPDGKVAVSRPFDQAPEGTIGWKANSIGITIENIGNFDKGFDVMTDQQKETIVYITALLCIKYGLTPSIESITYHHWWDLNTGERVLDNSKGHAVKTCPGTAFFGGNTTTSAKGNFYPLVTRKIEEILAETPD